jgi:hypothetical protein
MTPHVPGPRKQVKLFLSGVAAATLAEQLSLLFCHSIPVMIRIKSPVIIFSALQSSCLQLHLHLFYEGLYMKVLTKRLLPFGGCTSKELFDTEVVARLSIGLRWHPKIMAANYHSSAVCMLVRTFVDLLLYFLVPGRVIGGFLFLFVKQTKPPHLYLSE